MSIVLHYPGKLAAFSNTIFSHFEMLRSRNEPALKAYGGAIHRFADTVAQHHYGARYDQLKGDEKSGLRRDLMNHLVRENLAHFSLRYQHNQKMVQEAIEKTRLQVEEILNSGGVLDAPAYPLNQRGVTGMAAMISDISHGFDSAEDVVVEGLSLLEYETNKAAILLDKTMPEDVRSNGGYHVAAAWTHGDNHLGMHRAMSVFAARFQCSGAWPDGSHRRYYAADVVCDLVMQYLNGQQDKVVSVHQGLISDYELCTLKHLMSDDVPESISTTRESAAIAVRLLSDMAERYIGLDSGSFYTPDGVVMDGAGVDALRANLDTWAKMLVSAYVRETPDYKDYWNSGYIGFYNRFFDHGKAECAPL